ncbi:MAG: Xaa-Pro aminopeptidase [Zhongshania aliphaticivorans]|jgi:Xaa-Pro aminopeptidase
MKSKLSFIRVLYAASEKSADLFYLTKVFVPDPFLCVLVGNRSIAVVNRLEYGRVRSQSSCDEVLLLESVQELAAKALNLELSSVGPAELIRYFVKQYQVNELEVPASFPSVYYAKLLDAGLKLGVGQEPFFTERELKTDDEAVAIRKGNAASAAGIRAAERVLRASTIVGKRLKYEGRTLTAEYLRTLIDQACLAKGAVAQNTIVACGKQACDPHEVGHGPLKPNELIIIDVFPRMQKTGYHGDMTRTFLKGRANNAQRALVRAVRSAQSAALAKVKAGVSGATVHRAADEVFRSKGFYTERRGEVFVGFIHSTGHGLGLDIHESPRVSLNAGRLRKGHVITIEPGLYYPGIGGCRIEDVVRVTKDGCEPLSSMHYRWELR